MANNFSDYMEVQLRDHIFRTNTFAKPATLAIALTSAVPNDASTGASMNEFANSGGYARQVLAPNDSNWSGDSTTNGTTYNRSAITFPIATSTWGWASGFVITDSGGYGVGNALYWGAFDSAFFISSGTQFVIPVSGLSIRND